MKLELKLIKRKKKRKPYFTKQKHKAESDDAEEDNEKQLEEKS